MCLGWRGATFDAVRRFAAVVAVLALVCAAGSTARVAGSSAAAVSVNMVVVSTTADALNGDVSSLSALKARPGRDGISLREALSAADRTGGSATVYVMFSAALNGKTIEVRSELPAIRRDHLVLEGVAPHPLKGTFPHAGASERDRLPRPSSVA